MPASLAVQIVNFRTQAYLERCVASVVDDLAASPASFRILVLENGSGDDLGELEARFPGVVSVVESADNLGFGGGHNRLAAESDAPLICCLNPDIVVRPGAFAGLLAQLEDPTVVAAGPLLRTTDGAPQRWDHGELRGLRALVANGAGHAHWQPRTVPLDVAWVSGAFLVLRRSAFAAVGGFDERFFLYKEEEDLCLRLRQAGGRIVYDPRVAADHVGGVVAQRGEHMDRSTAYYVQKHFPGRRRAALDWLYRNVTRRI